MLSGSKGKEVIKIQNDPFLVILEFRICKKFFFLLQVIFYVKPEYYEILLESIGTENFRLKMIHFES